MRRKEDLYEVWSKGKARSWMTGLGLIETRHWGWQMAPPRYHCSSCTGIEDERKEVLSIPCCGIDRRKLVRILQDCVADLSESTAIIYDPLADLREHYPNHDPEVRKRFTSFLRQFPKCGSKDFNGALVLHGSQISNGVASVHKMYDAGGGCDRGIVLRRNRVLLTYCDHGGIHAECRERRALDLFNKTYRHHMGAKLAICEFEA